MVFVLLRSFFALSVFLWPLHRSIGPISPVPSSRAASGGRGRSTSCAPCPRLLGLRRGFDFQRELQRILFLPCGFADGFGRARRIRFLCWGLDVGVPDCWRDSAGIVPPSSCRGVRLMFVCWSRRLLSGLWVRRVVVRRSCCFGGRFG